MYVEREDELKSSLLQRVIARMHHAAKIPERLGEKLQIARYQEGERCLSDITIRFGHEPFFVLVLEDDAASGRNTVRWPLLLATSGMLFAQLACSQDMKCIMTLDQKLVERDLLRCSYT